ncbi:hypothetical protein [Lactovum odontotermitis]
MAKDKNADLRNEYNLKISAKERELTELKLEQKQAEKSFEKYEQSMEQSFRGILEIEENLNLRSHQPNAHSETSYRRQGFSQRLNSLQAYRTQKYSQALQALEDECETLQKERDNLSWD